MNETKGLIFDIQSHSVHDGPGSRTLIFLKGCPLHCQWCANPEGIEYRQRPLYRVTKCVHTKQKCVRCIEKCPYGAISSSGEEDLPLTIDWDKCKNCSTIDCVKACLNDAFVMCGKYYSVADLMRIFIRDINFWGTNGGVTFSGGEPLAQKDFIVEVLKQCKEKYIHTAIETSAYTYQEHFLNVFKYIDFAFIDIKHMDSNKHKEKTGIGNERILENITALIESGWPGRLIIRMPVIEDFNDTDENAIATAEFLKKLGLREMNILPFHRLGESKWRQLGKIYPYKDYQGTTDEVLGRIQDIYLDRDILCYVGSDTPF